MAAQQIDDVISMLRYMDQVLTARHLGRKLQRPPADPAPLPAIVTQQQHARSVAQAGTQIKRPLRTQKPRRRHAGQVAPRFTMNAKVLLHKNQRYLKGAAINISRSGLFVGAAQEVFQADEVIRVYIKPHGQARGYHALARVVRYNAKGPYPEGYGLKFVI